MLAYGFFFSFLCLYKNARIRIEATIDLKKIAQLYIFAK